MRWMPKRGWLDSDCSNFSVAPMKVGRDFSKFAARACYGSHAMRVWTRFVRQVGDCRRERYQLPPADHRRGRRMDNQNAAHARLLPVVPDFLEIDNGIAAAKQVFERAPESVRADQREGHEMRSTQIVRSAQGG